MEQFIQDAVYHRDTFFETSSYKKIVYIMKRLSRPIEMNLVYMEDCKFESSFICLKSKVYLYISFSNEAHVKQIIQCCSINNILTNCPRLFPNKAINIYPCAIAQDLDGVLALRREFEVVCKSREDLEQVLDFFLKYIREFKTIYNGKPHWIGNTRVLSQIVYLIYHLEMYPDVLESMLTLLLKSV